MNKLRKEMTNSEIMAIWKSCWDKVEEVYPQYSRPDYMTVAQMEIIIPMMLERGLTAKRLHDWYFSDDYELKEELRSLEKCMKRFYQFNK